MFTIVSGTFFGVGTRSPRPWGVASFRSRKCSVRWGSTACGWPHADLRGRRLKSVGKPDAGNRHVRFDERGGETGHRYRASPRLYSSEFDKLGRIPVLKARMNADLHMAGDLKNTG